MGDSSQIPPRASLDFTQLYDVITKVKDEKQLLKVKIDKDWKPIGVMAQSRDEAGRIYIWIHAAEYDLEQNVKRLKNEIEKAGKGNELTPEQLTELKTNYNDLIDKVATRKFQKKWYNFFTSIEEVEKRREDFKLIKFKETPGPQTAVLSGRAPPPKEQSKLIVDVSAAPPRAPLSEIQKAATVAGSAFTPPSTPTAGRDSPFTPPSTPTAAEQEEAVPQTGVKIETPSTPPTAGRDSPFTPRSSTTAVPPLKMKLENAPVTPIQVKAEPTTPDVATAKGNAVQENAAQLQELRVLTPVHNALKGVKTSLDELAQKFDALAQGDHLQLRNARDAFQKLGGLAQNTDDWQQKLQYAQQANETAKAAYLDILKGQAIDRAEKVKAFKAQAIAIIEAKQTIGAERQKVPSVAVPGQLNALERDVNALIEQIDTNKPQAYQRGKTTLDELEKGFRAAEIQLKKMQDGYAAAIAAKKEALTAEIARLRGEKAVDDTLRGELNDAQSTIEIPLVKGEENKYGHALNQVDEQIERVKTEVENKKRAFAQFSTGIKRAQDLLQGKLDGLPKDAAVNTALKENYLKQMIKKAAELQGKIKATTRLNQIPTGLVKIPFDQLGATVTEQLKVIDKAVLNGFSLSEVEKELAIPEDEVQEVNLIGVMSAIERLSSALKMVELLRETSAALSQKEVDPDLLQYQKDFLTAQQELVKQDPEQITSITPEFIEAKLKAMAEKFDVFKKEATPLILDLDTRELTDDQKNSILKHIAACETITLDFVIQIDDETLSVLQTEIAKLPKKE